MDTAMLSKMERSERSFKKEDIIQLARIFEQAEKDLLTLWLADRILKNCSNEEFVTESLQLALKKVKMYSSARHLWYTNWYTNCT